MPLVNRFDYFVTGRTFEWVMAIAMFFAGLEIIIWPNTSFGAAPILLNVISPIYIGVVMLVIGWVRISGLMLNGQMIFSRRVGPYIRAFCSVMAASLWGQFAMALIVLSTEQGYPSVGIPFWAMFTVGEFNAARAAVKNA